MSVPAVSSIRSLPTAGAAAMIKELQEQVHRMQGTAVSHSLPTLPALRSLVQLRTGASYAVDSPLLAMALMAGPSSAGAWCGVVGVPDFGIEAAAAMGVDPDRTVLVPEPGEAWFNVASAMVDVLSVVVVQPPTGAAAAERPVRPVNPHQVARLGARLRQRDAVLIALGDWPHCDARLRITRTRWSGIGQGHGHLSARRVRVRAGKLGSPSAEAELWLPDENAQIRLVEPGSEASPRLRAVAAG